MWSAAASGSATSLFPNFGRHPKRRHASLAAAVHMPGLHAALSLEFRQPFQLLHSAVNLSTRDSGGAQQAETFTAEGGHHAAVNHRATEIVFNRAPGCGEISHHAADERVARAGRVHDFVQRVGGTDEKAAR